MIKKTICIALLTLCCGQWVTAQTPAELKAWLPRISDWTISEETEVFNPENLFDRINGAAPLFIENNFVEMTSLEYKRGTDYITIQAYRHATPEDAFGMYASERSSELPFISIGGEAQGDKSSLFFFAGNMYVKMWSYGLEDASAILQRIGGGLAQQIDAGADYPAILQGFAPEGKLLFSEAYITANYIGHEFLKQVYLAKYTVNGKEFQVFVIDGKTPQGVKEILQKYLAFSRQTSEPKEGELVISDRYNGDMPMRWKGHYLIGVFSDRGDALEGKELLNRFQPEG